MKITFITEQVVSTHGGIQTHVRELSEEYKRKGIKLHFVNPSSYHLFTAFGKSFPNFIALGRALKKSDSDVIHIHGFSSFFIFISAFFVLSKKVVYTPHYHPFSTHRRPLLAKFFFHAFSKHMIRKFSAIVALTNHEKEFFDSYNKNIFVIPNGINLEEDFVNLKKKRKKLIFIGRDDGNKRLDFLENLNDEFKKLGCHLVVVTNVKKRNKSNVTYRSGLSKDELYKEISSSACIVIPSKYEAFSIVALEAFSLGCFGLISNRVMVKEYFHSTDNFVKIFKYGDSKCFLEKLKGFLHYSNDDFEKLSYDAVFFSKRFSWKRISEEIIEVYNYAIK